MPRLTVGETAKQSASVDSLLHAQLEPLSTGRPIATSLTGNALFPPEYSQCPFRGVSFDLGVSDLCNQRLSVVTQMSSGSISEGTAADGEFLGIFPTKSETMSIRELVHPTNKDDSCDRPERSPFEESTVEEHLPDNSVDLVSGQREQMTTIADLILGENLATAFFNTVPSSPSA